MHNQQKSCYSRFLYRNAFIASSLLLILTVALAACGNASTPPAPPTGSAPTATPNAPKTPTTSHYPIKVYFSKSPGSENNFQNVYPVDRISPTAGVATFAIQQLIAGPTTDEQKAGYYSDLGKALTGPSSCPDASENFTLTLNKKGSTHKQGTATLKFCRTLTSAGVGTDARIRTEIQTTLKQFSGIKEVVILTNEGHCFGDESGMDMCLK